MRVDEFDFDLPEDNIALRPAVPRDAARLLVVNQGAQELQDCVVSELADFLQPGDALVFNDTRVIPAQLEGVRRRGDAVATVGATLHLRESADTWRAFVRGAKKLKIGETVDFGGNTLLAEVLEKGEGGEVVLRFNCSGPDLDLALVTFGHVPLPPYIALKREENEQDRQDYQTIYAREDGAVAAPTAGLHFTDRLLASLEERGVAQHFVTLHVGAGTFLPVKVDDTEDHKMHSEIGVITSETAEALNRVRNNGGRIVSVGTTSLRLLESAVTETGEILPWSGATDIFITPGYRFKAIDALMTNFHLPRSTLFMLVSAFAGTAVMKRAYEHAIRQNYRFYSYGDSSLLFPKK
ncbi:MAG: tRNA preQ1(34) S-adenosylmethionine ribosyltransferase-isomerase QueA [Rhizobiaceae bacterium]|nr:tRNA preQ1(34) S-adenosylmethionine ribosyltransferase-isomerase QueA [Hyphomicrobiales bacterium]NRB31627.1 tRNA preQ1(34) S-adenosylmethionine ribosyltransferase-isomerase QueA [Rhizobiaceae bacterium]